MEIEELVKTFEGKRVKVQRAGVWANCVGKCVGMSTLGILLHGETSGDLFPRHFPGTHLIPWSNVTRVTPLE